MTLDPVTPVVRTKHVLAKNGFQCSIMTLEPGHETPRCDPREFEERVLFVIDGEATVRFGELNTMLKKDEALLISKGQAHAIAAGSEGGAKILRVDVPPRRVVTPQILTVAR